MAGKKQDKNEKNRSAETSPAEKKATRQLLDYLDASPTPFQSVENLEKMLADAGAVRLEENAEWDIKKGGMYYFIKDGSQIAAFKVGTSPVWESGFRIVAAHHDSPGFRIKPDGSSIDGGYERLALEVYGGPIIHGWLDRPLGIAGRICVKSGEFVKGINININEPLVTIPSAAIHYVRDVNDGARFNPQDQINPFFAMGGEKAFLDCIAKRAGVAAQDILSFELAPYDYEKACFCGENGEFVSSPRMDDAAMTQAAFAAFTQSADSPCTTMAFAYDHEEIGSNSNRGANSNTMEMIIERLCEKFSLSVEQKYIALAKSVVFSADMAHATHPAYAGKYDPNYPVDLNKGPVLKLTTRQSYVTSPRGSALFKMLCENNDIPYQVFINRSDERGGGTIGPGIAAKYGVTVMDIGNPILAMHAVREFGGAKDHLHMIRLMSALYRDDLTGLLC